MKAGKQAVQEQETRTMEKDAAGGPVALVTGGGRGLGRGISLGLAQTGWRVAINYHQGLASAQETLRQIENGGGQGLLVQADVAARTDRTRLVHAVLEAWGRIDLLVNNAGMAPRQRADLLEMSEESYDEVLAVNLKGPFFLTQHVAREMVALRKAGKIAAPVIVNIGSMSAYTSSVNRGEYCISKAGLGMLTMLFADRLAGEGILVYELRPGIMETDMTRVVKDKYDRLIEDGVTPIRRWGTEEDVARAVVAIAGGALPFSTGEVINIDGGFHLRRL
jgi:NAD(P)-dependent dehydrogenase (short-subunit alcohol dehydrogenase family)